MSVDGVLLALEDVWRRVPAAELGAHSRPKLLRAALELRCIDEYCGA